MKRNIDDKKLRAERRVISVHCKGKDVFFGSISAIFEHFNERDLGVTYDQLRYYLSLDNVFSNGWCRIVRGSLEAKRKKN